MGIRVGFAMKQCSKSRPRQANHHFADDIFNYIILNKKVSVSIMISLTSVYKGPIGYDNGLAPNRLQDITITNDGDDLINWCIYASLCLS